MKVVTAQQMRDLDKRALHEFHIPGVVLMENAGRAVFERIQQEYSPVAGKNIAVFCGTGNNGGDGFVIARYLHLAGARLVLFLVGNADALKADARTHYDIARSLGFDFITLEDGNFQSALKQPLALIVDALLGTGIKEAPREPYASVIQKINDIPCPVVAVDIPSGVDADTGATPGAAICADHTITFGYPKLGLLTFPGAANVGKLHIADIGFDWEALKVETPIQVLEAETVRPLLKKRLPDSNKGDYGHVGVLAGSQGMAGAPAMVARAAQRSGAGLVTVLSPACAQPLIAAKLDEQMTLPLPDADGAAAESAFDKIADFAKKATVFCIGPGMTTSPQTVALIHRLLVELDVPIVLDADGLNALALKPEVARQRFEANRPPLLITPHPGEAARLLNISIKELQADRIGSARELAARFHAIVVLKGSHSLVADPEGQISINTTGNPGMAAGGMGDTLTGILGGLWAQQIAGQKADNPEKNAVDYATFAVTGLGVYLHGLAGDLAAAEAGQVGLTAGDLCERLPHAIRHLAEAR